MIPRLMPTATASILVLADDLFVRSRIDAAARAGGQAVRYVGSLADFDAALTERAPRVFLVGMAATRLPWVDLIRRLRSTPGGSVTYVLAFGPHKDLEARQRALAAGADRVIANSAFVRALPSLLAAPDTEIDEAD